MEVVALAVPQHLHIHVFRGILGGAGTQAIKAQGIFVVAVAGAVVLAAGIQLAENKLPVEALFVCVPVQRTATAEVLDLYRFICIARERYDLTVSLARFIYGV